MGKRRNGKGRGRFTPRAPRLRPADIEVCRVWGCLGGCGRWHLWAPFSRLPLLTPYRAL